MPLLTLLSQSDFVVIDRIETTGLKHTKLSVVYRELDFAVGDTVMYSDINQLLLRNEKRLLSIGIFNLVDINIVVWDEITSNISLKVSVVENWYLYPAPIFELADRNFNVWWKEQGRSFSRVNYGLRVDHLNLTGHKDKAKLLLQTGYTRKYELDYQYPYFFHEWGLGGNLYFTENKEIGYETFANKINFIKLPNENVLLRRMRATLSFYRRNNAFLYQSFQIQYHRRTIDPSIAKLNAQYFLEENTKLNYLQLEYNIRYDKRVFATYPEGGYMVEVNLQKLGISRESDYKNMAVYAAFEKFHHIGNKLYIGGRLKAKANLTRNIVPYTLNSGLGYGGDRVRGYELYVMDGTDFLLAKTSIRYKIIDTKVNFGEYAVLEAFKVMPFTVYVRSSFESGYVNEPNHLPINSLSNQLLIGYGPAFDFLFFNNMVFSVEYNFNHLHEHGLYFESSINF